MRRTGASLLVTLAVAAWPSVSGAAEVSFLPEEDEPSFVVVRDRSDAANDLAITVRGDVVTVRERGNGRLTAQDACREAGPRIVRCGPDPGGAIGVDVEAGPGDDRVIVSAAGDRNVALGGGRGDDTLRVAGTSADLLGGPGRDRLHGGAHADRLHGNQGADRLSGGAGGDELLGDGVETVTQDVVDRGRAPDVLDGGRGHDAASWEGRRSPVRVDLRGGRGGHRGEEDRLRSIESATGGLRADVLLGTARRNVLYGSFGADVLVGQGGDDRLDGGIATPSINGEPDWSSDRLSCGAGRDLVVDAGRDALLDGPRARTDVVPRDCERIAASDAILDGDRLVPHPRAAGTDRVRVQVTCTEQVSSCRRVVTIHARGRLVARGASRVRAGVRWVTLRLRRPLPSTGTLDVRVHDQGRDADPHDFRYRIRR